VRVIAATFRDETAAERVLGRLREAFELRRTDAELAPLGVVGSDLDEATLLAGRFYDDRVPTIRALIERCGGRVVMDVDEIRTGRGTVPARASRPDDGRVRPSRTHARGEPTRVLF
jgi:hypothetical protein